MKPLILRPPTLLVPERDLNEGWVMGAVEEGFVGYSVLDK